MAVDEAGYFEKGRWVPVKGDIAYLPCHWNPDITAEMYSEYRKNQMGRN